uniref:Ig-like domain-containing protein n=1 Tax=Amphilophus citrinellus TaxID=61819 RepID=A0A3Q0TDY2_AMPCI
MVSELVLYSALYSMFSFTFIQVTELRTFLHREHDFVSANIGDKVTLHCFYEGDAARLYWDQQTLGQKPRSISTYYRYGENGMFHNEFKNNPCSTFNNGISKNHLKITDMRVSDSAIYYCAKICTFIFEFTKGTFLSVKGSSLDIQTLVQQSVSETIQPVGSNCGKFFCVVFIITFILIFFVCFYILLYTFLCFYILFLIFILLLMTLNQDDFH